MLVTVAPVTPQAVSDLLVRLRPIDRLELDCMSTGDPAEVLLRTATNARRSRAAYIDGEVVCIFGVSATTALSDTGCPWAMMTRDVERREIRRVFMEASRTGLDWMGQDFRRLWNLVAEENEVAIRWLKWLRFRFDGRGIDLRGHRFLHFEKEMC